MSLQRFAAVFRRAFDTTLAWSKTFTTDNPAGSWYYNYRSIITAANISTSGTRVRVRFAGHSTLEGGPYDSAAIGERSGTSGVNFVSTPKRLTFGGMNSFKTLAGQDIWSDWIEFDIDETKDYLVSFAEVSNKNANIRYGTGGTEQTYFEYSTTTIPDRTFDVSGAAVSSSNGNAYAVNGIEVASEAPDTSGIFNVGMTGSAFAYFGDVTLGTPTMYPDSIVANAVFGEVRLGTGWLNGRSSYTFIHEAMG